MKTVDESMTEEQIKSALRHIFQSEAILVMAIKMSLDEYRAIEAVVRKESAEHIAELEKDRDYCEKQWHIALATHENIAALKSRIAELERPIKRPAPCARHCEAQAFKIEIRALERQIADLQKDAARYRHIRRGQHWSLVNGIGDVLTGEDMDKAVDAAIKAKERT